MNTGKFQHDRDLTPEEYAALKAAITSDGKLLQPVIFQQSSGEVIIGHNRHRVVTELGWKQYWQEVADVDDDEAHLMSGKSNEGRQITAADRRDKVLGYAVMVDAEGVGRFTQAQIAEAAGVDQSTVSRLISDPEIMQTHNLPAQRRTPTGKATPATKPRQPKPPAPPADPFQIPGQTTVEEQIAEVEGQAEDPAAQLAELRAQLAEAEEEAARQRAEAAAEERARAKAEAAAKKAENAVKRAEKAAKKAEAERWAAYRKALSDWPMLKHWADDPDKVLDRARFLDIDEPERSVRINTVRANISLEQERAHEPEPPKREGEPDYRKLAGKIFDVANEAAGDIKRLGGAETLSAYLADGGPALGPELWHDVFTDLAALASAMADACRPQIRRVK